MRGRLTLAFVCLALALTAIGGVIRVNALGAMARADDLKSLGISARLIGTHVEDLYVDDRPVSSTRLVAYLPTETELTLTREGSPTLTVAASDFDADATEEGTRVQETVGATTVTLVEDASVLQAATRQSQTPLLAMLLVLGLLAALAGLVVATVIARPFRLLAQSADALGRGRFDFVPPRSRVPEVVCISTSLQASAKQLQDSLRRDREFFHHASHVLRTPLTGLRLELEELSVRDDLNEDARRSATRSLADAQRLESTVTELLDFARGRRLVDGAEVTLLTLGSDVAQRWRDHLPESREVRAFVDDGAEVTLTPGPVEQLLDSVLRDVSDNATGPVTLRFAGQDEHVKVTITSGPRRSGGMRRPSGQATQTIAEVLGGRCKGDATSGEMEILIPRR